MSIYTDIGQNIVSLRRKKGITQEQLALNSNTSISHLRSIEHGRANPSVGLLSRIADTLGEPLLNMLIPPELPPGAMDREDKEG